MRIFTISARPDAKPVPTFAGRALSRGEGTSVAVPKFPRLLRPAGELLTKATLEALWFLVSR
jgi:hypothetical protein